MEVGLIRFRQATTDDAPELARILTGTNEATFRGLVPDHCLVSPTPEESETNWRRALMAGGLGEGRFLIVAERVVADGEQRELVGYVLAGGASMLSGYDRELNVLMVDPSWQRQGIGRRLTSLAAAELQRQGAKSMLVGVQVDNPNRAFYEHLCGRLVGRRPLDWAGYETEEVLYGYDEVSGLVEHKSQVSST